MAMNKYRMPNKEEEEIIRCNGIDPEGVAVTYRDAKTIRLLQYKTRDEITIKQGDKKW